LKKLFIVRHAKSSWEYPELSDFDRPLNDRGKRDLPDMADRFAQTHFQPDLLVSSPANRALTTASGHADALGLKPHKIVQDQRHYHASSNDLISLIQNFEDRYECVMIFGHNPGLTYLINDLSGFDLDNLPTCAICGIELNVSSWSDLSNGSGRKFYYDFPKSR